MGSGKNPLPIIIVIKLFSYNSDKFIRSNHSLFSSRHVLERKLTLIDFILTSKCNEWNILCISIAHLLLHLCTIRIHLCSDTSLTSLSNRRQTICSFLLAKVDKQKLCSVYSFFRI